MVWFGLIGKLLPMLMGGGGESSLCCLLRGHKFIDKVKGGVVRLEHQCPDCNGQGARFVEGDGGGAHVLCETCNGTKVDPENPLPLDERTERGQRGRNRRTGRDKDKPVKWKRQGKKLKVVMPHCVRCGKRNPDWATPEKTQDEWWLRVLKALVG